MSNYADQLHTKKDAWGAGLTIGVMVSMLFVLTGLIVLPFMPEVAKSNAPILLMCKDYLGSVLTLIYWVVVIFAVISTAPTFTFNMANRWAASWKTTQLPQRIKFFILSMTFLLICWFVSGVGLLAIVKKGYVMLGDLALYSIVFPLFISIFRVHRLDRQRAAEGATD